MEEIVEKKKPIFYKKEIIVISLFIVLLSFINFALAFLFKFSDSYFEIKMNESQDSLKIYKDMLLPSFLMGGLFNIILFLFSFFIKLTPDEKVFNKPKNIIPLIILFLLGILAYIIIIVGLCSFNMYYQYAVLISTFIELCYFYLMIKLYVFNYIESKNIFYEILRFALVGIIASLFDFCTCFIFEKYILANLNSAVWKTVISVTCGFIIGVIVNYICSVYMVFKSTTDKDKSKTLLGKFLFLLFATIGLFMGIGLQYLFYNYLKIGYVITYVIRTLIVLVWNYLSRKYFIFK